MKKYPWYMILFLVVAIAGIVRYADVRTRAEAVPEMMLIPRFGDARASSEFLNAQHAVEYYRTEIRKHPEAVRNYVQLAQLFIQESRVTGRHHEYMPKASYLLDEALKRAPDDFEATVTKASMFMTMHRFLAAKELAEKAIMQNEYNAFAYGVLCDALVELGDYDRAVTTCDKMIGIRPDLRSYARASYLRELNGDNVGACDAMCLAADAGASGDEGRAWALYNLGTLYLHSGKLDTAEYIFRGVLQERPDYAFAESGLSQIDAARGKINDAVSLLSKAAEGTPEHVFLEQLADLFRGTGQASSADGTARIVLKAFEQHESDGWNINREYALFCANHGLNLSDALRRIQEEYGRRPGNIDVLDTYAWVLFKCDRAAEAVPFIEQAQRLGTHRADLSFHAALIYRAAGEQKRALASLHEALAPDRFLSILYADSARSLLSAMTGLAAR